MIHEKVYIFLQARKPPQTTSVMRGLGRGIPDGLLIWGPAASVSIVALELFTATVMLRRRGYSFGHIEVLHSGPLALCAFPIAFLAGPIISGWKTIKYRNEIIAQHLNEKPK